jgi:hypothetical protein
VVGIAGPRGRVEAGSRGATAQVSRWDIHLTSPSRFRR